MCVTNGPFGPVLVFCECRVLCCCKYAAVHVVLNSYAVLYAKESDEVASTGSATVRLSAVPPA